MASPPVEPFGPPPGRCSTSAPAPSCWPSRLDHPRTVEELGPLFDDIVCLETPVTFWAIGQFYADFAQTSDEEVVELLAGR